MSSTARLSKELASPSFSAARQALDNERLPAREYCAALTAATDRWLGELHAHASADRRATTALVAVGGYGRGELCPRSDLDVVLVHDGGRDVAAIAEALWYPIWDDGVHLDYSVRTPAEMLEMARRDVKVAMGLLTARVVAGDATFGEPVLRGSREQWRARAKESRARLKAECEERWAQYGDVAFLLEPDLKLARGGLRDVEAIQAAVAATDPSTVALAGLSAAADVLLAARVALHHVTGRRTDQLTLDTQDVVAARLGYRDADALMAAIATAARRVAWTGEDVARRARATGSTPDRVLGPGLALRAGQVVLTSDAALETDASLAFRAAANAAEHDAPIALSALQSLTDYVPAPGGSWDAATRDAFVAMLGRGHAAIPAIETLDHAGVLERYLPEWKAVRHKPQRNAYHRFTVDRHLCETAAHAAALMRNVHRPDLLLVAALLHDIGKGSPGDHTIAGEALIADIATRMGFADNDVDDLVRLVRYHLLLADVATRRDVDDPATARLVAEKVGTPELLDLLHALTEADGTATGTAAWGSWKADLVAQLVARAHATLAGHPRMPVPRELTDEQQALIAAGELRLLPDADNGVTVVAPDRPGLLAYVAGTFALHKLSVREASAWNVGAMACDAFVIDAPWDAPDWSRVERDLANALAGALDIEAGLARRADAARAPRRMAVTKAAPPRVIVDNTSTPAATIVEVRAADAVGVLYRLAAAIAESGFDIESAKVLTLGHEVVDTFYVVDARLGRRSTDPAALRRLEDALLSALRRPWSTKTPETLR